MMGKILGSVALKLKMFITSEGLFRVVSPVLGVHTGPRAAAIF